MNLLLIIPTSVFLFYVNGNANIFKTTHPAAASFTTYRQDLTPPEFPGGNGALYSYVMKDLVWPKNKNKDTLQTIVVSFFVEKDGYLSDLKVEKSLTPEFDVQVLRIISKLPRWIPAMRNNKPIKSRYRLPIRYHLPIEGQ